MASGDKGVGSGPTLQARHIGLHRALGRLYLAAVLVGWFASILVGLHAETGRVASASFLVLGVFWAATTGTAVARILAGNVPSHRRWMVRSYALAAAAITLRLYLGTAIALKLPFATAHLTIAWLCWVPNLAFAELLLRRPARHSGRTPPSRAPAHGVLHPRRTAFGTIPPDIQENEHA